MTGALSEIIVGTLLLVSASFVFIASIGLIRFPDVYNRMHAASKAGNLGAVLAMLALGFYSTELGVASRAMAGAIFFLMTAPVSAHLIARVAYHTGIKPWEGTVIDEYGKSMDKEKR